MAGWFQESNVRQIKFTKFTKNDLIDIKSLGIDHIRLPLNLEFMTDGKPNYVIDPLFFQLLDEVVNWTEELEIHLILDNHTFDVNLPTPTDYEKVLIPIWQQMAMHYKDRSNLIYYEILNEPHDIDDISWNNIQLQVIEAIRDIDNKHTIVIGPAGWNSYNNLDKMFVYNDPNLIYTFHFYDPFLFTHQGASWTNPSFVPLSNIPFPYDASKMPIFPEELKNTWVENSFYNSYKTDGTIQKVKSLIDIAYNFGIARNVQIHCGELGVYMKNSDTNSRIWWHSVVIPYLESLNIPWTIWDYKGDFGLFEKGSNAQFDYDLNAKLLNVMNLNVPVQKEFILLPDTSEINFYSDYVDQNININPWAGAKIDYYSDETKNGQGYSLHWSEGKQYNSITFFFSQIKDLSFLVENNYQIDFWMKAKGSLNNLDIRFIDSKSDVNGDHPWRMRYKLSPFDFQLDNNWYHIQIPLKYFTEGGSWDDNSWFDPIGAFNWKDVEYFEITSEYGDFNGSEFWFDEIKISDPSTVSVKAHETLNAEFQLYQNYPNPFNPSTTIRFSLNVDPNGSLSIVELKILDVLGRGIKTLFNEPKTAGTYEINYDASELTSGVYFYQLRVNDFIETKKIILIK